jgi:hypothetical protein
MIGQYDEFPVHQSPHPFAQIPITDYAWNEGYFFGLYNADEGVFFFSGMRVNPNTDMIGSYAGVGIRGRQYTTRFSRPWRAEMDTQIGPLTYEFLEPLKTIRLALDQNDSDLTFDFRWIGTSTIYEEPHHLAESRGRRVADLTRYYQSGTADGWLQLGDERFEFTPGQWWGSRDHSWGVYLQRAPLVPDPKWLPPAEEPAVRRGLRWASWWGSEGQSGFFSLHESEEGEQVRMNDVFGTPLAGGIEFDGRPDPVKIVEARHEMEFHPGTSALVQATWYLKDEHGGAWKQHYEVRPGGWNPAPIGYRPGSWKDGGSMFTYHGVDGVAQEWDDFDFSATTYDHTMYDGTVVEGTHSFEYLMKVTTTAPDGTTSTGHGQAEVFIARYTPYGFDTDSSGKAPGQGS